MSHEEEVTGHERSSADESLLKELARSALSVSDGEDIDFSASGPAPGWPARLIPPTPVVAVGGARSGTNFISLFQYPHESARPLMEYAAMLESTGWQRPLGILGEEGFRNISQACYIGGSEVAILGYPPPGFREKTLVVLLGPSDGWDALEDEPLLKTRQGSVPVPLLQPHPAVTDTQETASRATGRRGWDEIAYSQRVTTKLPPAELIPFYASQLAAAGWRLEEFEADEDAALQRLEFGDEAGRTWRGRLDAERTGDEVELFLFVARDDDE